MGVLNLWWSVKKSWRLRKISLKLAHGSWEEEQEYLEKLIDLCFEDKYIKIYLEESGISRGILKSLYYKLSQNGAGQFVDDHYVAASSLVYVTTLDFIFDYFIDGRFIVNSLDDRDSSLLISNRLILYFKNKEMGEIPRF